MSKLENLAPDESLHDSSVLEVTLIIPFCIAAYTMLLSTAQTLI